MKEIKEKIIPLINENGEADAYSITAIRKHSDEAFFIQNKLDMNRRKDVTHFVVTIYKDFEENGEKYRGSADIKISPEASEKEIKEMICEAVFAARFVKNKWYPLPKPVDCRACKSGADGKKENCSDTCVSKENLSQGLVNIKNAIYEAYGKTGAAKINSCEIFRSASCIYIINSEGVEVKFKTLKDELEIITECNSGNEPVEIYGSAVFSEADYANVKEIVSQQLEETEERSAAEKAKHIKNANVIITNGALLRFFGFYYNQTSSALVYNKSSAAKLGENFQGADVKGDKVSVWFAPDLPGLPGSAPYDGSGFPLKRHELLKNGEVKTFHGGTRFAHYLGIEPTGAAENFEVAAGSKTAAELKKEPYVEILAFSDFFMDDVTGDFGGEFRLARMFDGKETRIVNNGSISGNMFQVQKEFYFSKETMVKDRAKCPKFVLIPNMEVMGE